MPSPVQPGLSDLEVEYDSAYLQSQNKPITRGPLEMETVPRPRPREVLGGVDKEGGIFLTWEDLSVTASNGKGGSRLLLQGLTGFARPGEVLAIMGPSGCGKSTLLDALAGRLGSNISQSGMVLVNGHQQTLAYGTSAYVTQDDTLITTLTVGEAVCYSALLQLPDSMSKSEKKERADMTIREMGLQDAVNTRIGGWGVKGISGGQKRRVSICIEILTHPKLLFLDEPTSGLDSAASYYVMSRITGLDRQHGRTIITSIHQPSCEVFALFDNLCLLSSGRTVYFGPAHAADEFFSSNGFPCPTHQNPSDHFLKTINKDFEQDIEQGFGGKKSKEEAIDILTKAYKSSGNFQQVQSQVAKIHKKEGGALKKRSHASFLNQCLVLTRRSFVNMYRDLGYYWLRLAVYIALTIALGTIFYNVGHSNSSIKDRGAMLMYVASFLTFMTIGGFPSFVEDMKVFGRERLNGHYGSSAFVVGNTLSSIPYLLVISLIPGAIAYYLTGLQKGCEHSIYYALVLFTCMILVEGLMMIVASIVPNFLMGIITGAGIQGLLMLSGGFFRLPDDFPKPFWRYPLYYLSFNKYAYQGLYKNEFQGLKFPNDEAGGPPIISGEEILRKRWQVEMVYSKWIDLAILLGMAVLYRPLFLITIKTTEKVIPLVKALVSRPSKRSKQVMANLSATPSATPLHGANP
uniref:ABC transporter G family member 11.4 n=1 Tax=Vitis vinifera TaxID=29760 RepID=A0A1L5YKD8_VITVI|nr:ABC transporter G family member 11.4 [Vitis vinifera]